MRTTPPIRFPKQMWMIRSLLVCPRSLNRVILGRRELHALSPLNERRTEWCPRSAGIDRRSGMAAAVRGGGGSSDGSGWVGKTPAEFPGSSLLSDSRTTLSSSPDATVMITARKPEVTLFMSTIHC